MRPNLACVLFQDSEWLIYRVVPITTSQTESRIRGYIAAGDIELTKDEIEAIDKEGKRRDLGLIWTKGGMMRGVGFCLFTLILILVFQRSTRGL